MLILRGPTAPAPIFFIFSVIELTDDKNYFNKNGLQFGMISGQIGQGKDHI